MKTIKTIKDVLKLGDREAFKPYRKKPVVISAAEMNQAFKVKTKEGIMNGKKGDFLICGIENELYPCDKKIFKKTYDEMESGTAELKGIYSDSKIRSKEDVRLIPKNFLTRILWKFLKIKIGGPPDIQGQLNEEMIVWGLLPKSLWPAKGVMAKESGRIVLEKWMKKKKNRKKKKSQ